MLNVVANVITQWDQITSKIVINRPNNTLDITAIGLFHNEVFHYSLDGWTGRYSMPLEFLLSTHIATMAPDLSYKLATTFNTDVEILLWKSKQNSLEGGVQQDGGEIVTYEGLSTFYPGIDSYNKKERAAKVFAQYYPQITSLLRGDDDEDGPYWCINDDCSEKAYNGEIDKTCEPCADYVLLVFRALKAIHDKNFDVFVPYINSVTDHWFRNVYFTYGGMKQYAEDNGIDVPNVIVSDEDYYLSTGEMWTEYEMNAEGTDYELYAYFPDSTGNYSGEFAENGTIVCREQGPYSVSEKASNLYDKKGDGGYGLYVVTGTDGNKTYSPYNGNVEEFRVGKKAITKPEEDEKWNVYNLNPEKTGEDEWLPYESESEDENEYIKKAKDLKGIQLMYNLVTVNGNITQVEDGVRGETNAQTKKLFLDDYYLYDGSGPRAALIEAAKVKADSDDPDSFREQFGTSEQIKATYKNKSYTATIDAISGPVNILQNSLSAFSILKNMHTLDAEYIYHDFKELIVELDYFDKEDLIESEREVMMFPISGISSAGWPVARYDKSEDFYGTLIHSAQDYEALKQKTIEELAELLGDEGPVDEPEDAEDANIVVTDSNPLLMAADDISTYMRTNSYTYSQNNVSTTFEGSKTSKICDCSAYVSWVLQEVGIFESGIRRTTGTLASEVEKKNSDWVLTSVAPSNLQAGDIIIVRTAKGDGHTQIYAGDDKWYNAGSTSAIQNPPKKYSFASRGWTLIAVIRIPPSEMTYNGVTGSGVGSITMANFEGYQGEEAVLAPVTGEVIKYGTVKRKNLETGVEDEEVGFIKIRVLGNEEAVPGSTCKYFGDDDDLKGYNYFWEEYTEASITDHVLYIEGFDVSKVLGGTGDEDCSIKGGNISALSSYIVDHKDTECSYSTEYEVPKMADETRMETLLKQEKAKEKAVYTTNVGDKIYIKEGAVIGHTYPEGTNTVDGVGNYMRLIFRDVDDQVVENVEEYMEIEEPVISSVTSESQEYTSQPGDLELLAALIHGEGSQTFFTNNVFNGNSELGAAAARATGYVCVNRAITNYGGHGTTIEAQILAPGQYAKKYVDEAKAGNYCDECLANAEWCLKYDCSSIANPSGVPMSRQVLNQSGWCRCKGTKFNCWWWIDTTKDGKHTEFTNIHNPWDTFFCE